MLIIWNQNNQCSWQWTWTTIKMWEETCLSFLIRVGPMQVSSSPSPRLHHRHWCMKKCCRFLSTSILFWLNWLFLKQICWLKGKRLICKARKKTNFRIRFGILLKRLMSDCLFICMSMSNFTYMRNWFLIITCQNSCTIPTKKCCVKCLSGNDNQIKRAH